MKKGKYRFISKPFKRYIFKYADSISDYWTDYTYNKYVLKYIRKMNKKSNLSGGLTSTGLEHEENLAINFYSVPGLVEFAQNLKIALIKEKGVAHAKAREYWLRRAPRLLGVILVTILLTIGLSELIKEQTVQDRLFSIILGTNMIILSFYMLYQRLPDSIAAAMMRIGHDYYARWKLLNI